MKTIIRYEGFEIKGKIFGRYFAYRKKYNKMNVLFFFKSLEKAMDAIDKWNEENK